MYGWILVSADNDSTMLPPERAGGATCPHCGRKVADVPVDPGFQLRERGFDLSETEEGYWIASQEFKDFCDILPFSNLEFVPLPNDPGFYWFRVHSVAEYQPPADSVHHDRFCRSCHAFGAVEGFLEPSGRSKALPEGIHRSEFEYGQGLRQRPLMLVGEKTGISLNKRRFRGVYLSPLAPGRQPGVGPGALLVKAS